MTTHLIGTDFDTPTTYCCDESPSQLPRDDRITLNHTAVDCRPAIIYLECCDMTVIQPSEWAGESLTGCTMDCPICNTLLMFVDEVRTVNFHAEMHRRNPTWPADGKRTGYIDI